MYQISISFTNDDFQKYNNAREIQLIMKPFKTIHFLKKKWYDDTHSGPKICDKFLILTEWNYIAYKSTNFY